MSKEVAVTHKITTTPEGLRALGPGLNALIEESDLPHPFGFPGATLSWYEVWGNNQGDKLRFHSFTDADGVLRAVFPLIEVRFGPERLLGINREILPGIKVLKPVGRAPNEGVPMEIKPFLISPGWEKTVATAFLGWFNKNTTYTWADLSGLLNTKQTEALFRHDPKRQKFPIENYYFHVNVPENMDDFVTGFSKNWRDARRKRMNKMERQKIDPEIIILDKPEDISQVLERFFTLHKAVAQRSEGSRHVDYYKPPNFRKYLKSLVHSLPPGVFKMAMLKIGDEIQAMRIYFEFNKWLYLFDSGYNPDYGNLGIMRLLNEWIVRSTINTNINNVNLSVGGDANKRNWNPTVEPIYGARLIPHNPKAERLYRLAAIYGYLVNHPI